MKHSVLLRIISWLLLIAGCGGSHNNDTSSFDAAPRSSVEASIDIDLFSLLEPITASTYMCSHFVDPEGGADTNSGLSADTAWASFDKVTEYSRIQQFLPGDVICLRRGHRFVVKNGRFGSSGAQGLPIILGAYGDASMPRPRLSVSVPIQDSPNWQNVGGGIYLWPETHPSWIVSGFWEDDVWLQPASTSDLSDGRWFYLDGTGTYYRPTFSQPSDHRLYFAKGYGILGLHQQSNITISDIAFEYAGSAITGSVFAPNSTGPAIVMHDIMILNCEFRFVSTAIELRSRSFDGIAYENHDISIIGNIFTDVRYAMRFHNATNGPERTYNVQIIGNAIRNIALGGAYVPPNFRDIEAISFQNPAGVVISDNDLRYGLKEAEGYVNAKGYQLSSLGIILWRHPESSVEKVRVLRNRVHDLSKGIVISSGVQKQTSDVLVANNIVSDCELGLKLNDLDTNNTYIAAFNTLYGNNVNLELAPVTGSTVVGNLSIKPASYHLVASGNGGTSVIDSNGYFPDGPLFMRLNMSDSSLTRVYDNLAAWQQAFPFDANSIAGSFPYLVSENPLEPEDFMLMADSGAVNHVPNSTVDLDSDFAARPRPVGSASDIGAWEYQ